MFENIFTTLMAILATVENLVPQALMGAIRHLLDEIRQEFDKSQAAQQSSLQLADRATLDLAATQAQLEACQRYREEAEAQAKQLREKNYQLSDQLAHAGERNRHLDEEHKEAQWVKVVLSELCQDGQFLNDVIRKISVSRFEMRRIYGVKLIRAVKDCSLRQAVDYYNFIVD
jgi:hypothetical protein